MGSFGAGGKGRQYPADCMQRPGHQALTTRETSLRSLRSISVRIGVSDTLRPPPVGVTAGGHALLRRTFLPAPCRTSLSGSLASARRSGRVVRMQTRLHGSGGPRLRLPRLRRRFASCMAPVTSLLPDPQVKLEPRVEGGKRGVRRREGTKEASPEAIS